MEKYNIQQATEFLNKEAEVVTNAMWTNYINKKRTSIKLIVFRGAAKLIISNTDIKITMPQNEAEVDVYELCKDLKKKEATPTKLLNNYVKNIFEKEQEQDKERFKQELKEEELQK